MFGHTACRLGSGTGSCSGEGDSRTGGFMGGPVPPSGEAVDGDAEPPPQLSARVPPSGPVVASSVTPLPRTGPSGPEWGISLPCLPLSHSQSLSLTPQPARVELPQVSEGAGFGRSARGGGLVSGGGA